MDITIVTGGADAATGPVPPSAPSVVSNETIQTSYTGYGYLVRSGYPAQAVRLSLQDNEAVPTDVTLYVDLSSSYLYYDYLNSLAATPKSGWSAYHADTLDGVPDGGVTVFNAVVPGQPDPSNGCTAMGYTHGHVMIGSTYNGPAACRGNWLGGGLSGGTYFIYLPA